MEVLRFSEPSVTGPLPSPQKAGLMGCSATVYKPKTLPSLIRCRKFLLTVTFSPTQSCDALVTDGSPSNPTRWSAWRDIRVGSESALIPLVTRPLPSLKKSGPMGCAAPPFINLEPSYLSSDVKFFVLSITQGPTSK